MKMEQIRGEVRKKRGGSRGQGRKKKHFPNDFSLYFLRS
jgi:hypothetical protein